MFSDDGQQHQWGVVLGTLGTMHIIIIPNEIK